MGWFALHDTRRTRLAFAVLLTAGLALLASDYLGGSASLRTIAGTVFGTTERAVRSVTSPLTRFFGDGSNAGSSQRAQELERKLIRLRAQLSGELLSKREYAQLANLLRLPGRGRHRVIGADVIAVGRSYQQAVTLDVGTHGGVRPRETVLNAAGLVGTITSVGPWTCTVLLATDPAAVAGVRIAGSGELGWVTGTTTSRSGRDLLRLRVLGASTVVAPGQQLVTAASVGNRPYVAGVPVGVITRVNAGVGLTRTALVRPFADFSALDVVAVVVPPGKQGAGG